jgi:hypothetical protein
VGVFVYLTKESVAEQLRLAFGNHVRMHRPAGIHPALSFPPSSFSPFRTLLLHESIDPPTG